MKHGGRGIRGEGEVVGVGRGCWVKHSGSPGEAYNKKIFGKYLDCY